MQAILFDLDGTLLPMDVEEFSGGYLRCLAQKVATRGYEREKLIDVVWKGVHAMVKNDGTMTNRDRFWEAFALVYGDKVYEDIPVFDEFYAKEFAQAVVFTAPDPEKAQAAVRKARQQADRVILATNPLFPRVGVETRLNWLGLSTSDFDYVSTYENSAYCKPSPAFYRELLAANRLDPAQCLMIGNDVDEDVWAAAQTGLSTFLVRDCLVNKGRTEPKGPSGSFDEMLAFLDQSGS